MDCRLTSRRAFVAGAARGIALAGSVMALGAGALCLTGCAFTSYPNAEKYTCASEGEVNEQVGLIEIDWPENDVVVKPCDGGAIRLYETSDVELYDIIQMHYWVDGRILHVKEVASGQSGELPAKTLTVEVPASFEVEGLTVNCKNGSASVYLPGVSQIICTADNGSVRVYADEGRGFSATLKYAKGTAHSDLGTFEGAGKVVYGNGATKMNLSAKAGSIEILAAG